MTETNGLMDKLPVCLESIPASERAAVDAVHKSCFLAAVPKNLSEVPGEVSAATEVFQSDFIERLREGYDPEASAAGDEPAESVQVRGRLGFDVHWLREIVPGKLDGVAGLRILAEEPFDAWVETRPSATGRGAWVVLPPANCEKASPLLMALMGIHPLEWVWSLWTEIGGPAWKSLAGEANVRTADLEEFPRVWAALGTAARARLWHAAGDARRLEVFAAALEEEVKQTPVTHSSVARDSLRILTAPNLRRLFLYVRGVGAQQFDSLRVGRALTNWNEYVKLHPWIRRRLSGLLNACGTDLWPAVQQRGQLARRLEMRIRSMVRSLIAARLTAAEDPATDAGSDFYISLHLPFFDRKKLLGQKVDWTDPTLIAAGSTTLIVCPAREKPMLSIIETEVAQTLATPFRMAEAAGAPMEGELTFSYRRTAEPGWRNPYWAAILAEYGFPENVQDQDSVLTLTLPIDALQAWARIPPARESAYVAPMSRMAQSLQQTLRTWIPALHFTSPAALETLRSELPLLVYSCIEPVAGKSRCHFTYDPADPADMQKALKSASRRLQSLLKLLAKESELLGIEQPAKDYVLRDPAQAVKWVARHPRTTGTILATESFVIEEFIRLADMLRELKAMLILPTSNTVKQLAHFVDDFVVTLNRRLRRVHHTDCSAIAPLLLLRATAALQPETPVVATLTVDNGGRTTTYKSPMAA